MIFPTIKKIDDVLPAIKGHDEFIMAEKPFGTVINYVVVLEDSFNCPIRRECRGIVFDPHGNIMSRPFHKFFNLGERNETHPANLDFGADPVIMDKLDGSMIRPIYYQNQIHLGTKMGITDVAKQAYAWMRQHDYRDTRESGYFALIRECYHRDLTPIFEWCSRQQRIVVDYEMEDLVLTAVRHNHTGQYMIYDELREFAGQYGISVVTTWKNHDLDALQKIAEERKDIEGWVVAWPDGKRVKIKVDWYVALHKVKEAIAREKYVIQAILDDFLDDLKGKLQEQDLRAVEAFEKPFRIGLHNMIAEVTKYWQDAKGRVAYYVTDADLYTVFESEKQIDRARNKYLATVLMPRYPKWMHATLYDLWSGKLETPTQGVVQLLKSRTRTQNEIDANRHLWGGARFQYGGVPIDV